MVSRRELVGALNVFSTEELLSNIIPDTLPLLEWDRIKREIVRLRESMGKKNIVDHISQKLLELNEREQIEIIDHLNIMGLILHSTKYKWKAFELIGDGVEYLSSYQVQRNIKKELLKDGTRGEVTTKLEAEMQWIRIVEKKLVRGRGVISQSPVCVAVSSGYSYMFVKGAVKKLILACVVKALGKESTRDCKLVGKDIKSLLSMLKSKETQANSTKAVINQPGYRKARPSSSAEGVDFIQRKNRHNYCTEIFTNDDDEMPQLEEMDVKFEGVCCNVDHLVPEMEGKPFSMQVTFRSTSIAQMFTEMAALGVMSTPLPEYARKLPILGRNSLEIKY